MRKRGIVGRFFAVGLVMLVLGSCGAKDQQNEEGSQEPGQNQAFHDEAVPASMIESSGQWSDWGFAEGAVTYYESQAMVGGSEASQGIGSLTEPPGPVRVVDWGPVDELPAENRRPRVFVTFSHPITALAKLGEVQTESSTLRIDPPIPGVYRWYGSRTLVFIPDQNITAQQPVHISVDPGLQSLGGSVLDPGQQDFSFSFFRERLDFTAAYPGRAGTPINPQEIPLTQREFTLLFNAPVDPEHLSSFIQVDFNAPQSDDPLSLAFTLRHPPLEDVHGDENLQARTVILRLDQDLPGNSPMKIRLRQGASAQEGYIPTLEEITREFHTLRPFEFVEYTTRSYNFPRTEQGDSNPIFIEFSHDLDQESIEEKITVDLPVDTLSDHVEVFRNIIKLNNLPVDYESTYTVTIEPGIRDIYGRAISSTQVLEVEIPRAARFYYFPNQGSRMLEAQFEPKIIFEHQNMDSGVWRIGTISDPFRDFPPSTLKPYDFSGIPENTRWFDVKDLRPYLNESGKGWVGVSWNFAEKNKQGVRPTWAQTDLQIQVTDMGVTLRYGYNKALVWVKSLTDNAPVAGATVSLIASSGGSDYGNSGQTNSQGLAEIDLEPGEFHRRYSDSYDRDNLIVRVEKDDDLVEFKPNNSHNLWAQGIYSTTSPPRVESPDRATFLFSDRGLYKPGETITFRGIDRTKTLAEYQPYQGNYSLSLVSSDWRVEEPLSVLRGTATENGGFYGEIQVTDDVEPGLYYLEYQRSGSSRYDRQRVPVQVAFFRRAAFEVKLTPPVLDVILGEPASVGIEANYLSGGGMAGASYHYDVTRTPVFYRPPGNEWEHYRFGPLENTSGGGIVTQGEGTLDGLGRADQRIVTTATGMTAGLPLSYSLEARVQDVDSQELAGRTSFTAHPAAFYAGLAIRDKVSSYWGGYFAEAGRPLMLESVLVDIEGNQIRPTRGQEPSFTLEIIKRSWKVVQQQGVNGRLNTRYERQTEVLESREIDYEQGTSSDEVRLPESGSYLIRLVGEDDLGRNVVSEISVYATGVGYTRWWGEDAQNIQLLPDRQEYHVGDTAKVFVQTPLPDGEYLMAIEREGISDHRIIQIAGSQTLLEVPITDEHVPVIYITLSTTSERQETPKSYFEPDLGKPKGYFGAAQLFVNPETRRFDIEILPEQPSYKPGETATVQLRVTKDDQPLEAAEVTLMAVDRGVVDLINYRVPDPVAFFYDPSRFPLGVRGADSRSLLIDPVTYEVKNLQGGDSGGEKLDERKDFRPTAYFEPYLVSDENGLIEVQMDLPDSLTTYRLTAVGVKDDTFSLREHELLVSNPITMRASLPRLMRERDTAFTGVVVTNLTGDPQEVKVSLSIQGEGLIIDSAYELDQVISPGKSLEFPFQVAAVQEGEVDLIFTLESDQGIRDRLRTSLAIQRPLTPETTSVFGTLTEDSQEAVALPSAAAQGFGELRIQIHGTRLFQIAKPVARLHEIWYAGLSSQILKTTPSMILGEGLKTLIGRKPLGKTSITGLIRDMALLQHPDGGFVEIPGSMERIQESSPWSTLRAANFLADYADSRALDTRAADLSGTSLSSLDMVALENRLRAMVQDARLDAPTQAYAYYLQARLFGAEASSGAKLLALGDGLGMDGLGFVALAGLLGGQDPSEAESIAITARSRMMNFVNISPRGVDFLQTYETRSYFDAPARRLALLYQLLAILDPASDHLDRIAHTMVQEVSRGQWRSYDDLLWTLTTLAPSNPARQLAGESTNRVEGQVDDPSGNQKVQSSAQVSVQFSDLTLVDAQSVELLGEPISAVFPLYEGYLADMPRNTLLPLRFSSEEGDPPVQYAATLTYALPDEVITARDEGIGVVTWVEKTDGTRLPWKELERGETYRMVVNLETPSRYYNLALRIPLPSGAEILDSSLTTTGRYAGEGGVDQRDWTRETEYGDTTTYVDEGYMGRNSGGWWFSSIRPEKRIYDGEVHYYFGSVYEGSQTVSFLFRAVTPGIYPLAPARAELMDEPEVFGRSGGELAIIK